MPYPNKTRPMATVTLTLILIMSSFVVLDFGLVNAQSTHSSAKVLLQVTNEHLMVSHIWGNRVVMQLEKGDRVEGKFTVSKIFYYPNWPTIDLKAEAVVKDPNETCIYSVYTKSEGSFNFTALQSGNYTFFVGSNLVGELLWGGYYLYTSEINQATPLEVALNYTITGAPLEIGISSPVNQTYLQNNVLLDFYSSRVYDWAGYSLDGAGAVPICDSNSSIPSNNSGSIIGKVSTHANIGNTTLTDLYEGAHTLTLYANDTYGHMNSETVVFTVEQLDNTSLTTIIPWIVVIVAAVLAVGIYWRRFKQKSLLN